MHNAKPYYFFHYSTFPDPGYSWYYYRCIMHFWKNTLIFPSPEPNELLVVFLCDRQVRFVSVLVLWPQVCNELKRRRRQ